jgi:hypothetical protein
MRIERILPILVRIKDLKMVASHHRGFVQSMASDVHMICDEEMRLGKFLSI